MDSTIDTCTHTHISKKLFSYELHTDILKVNVCVCTHAYIYMNIYIHVCTRTHIYIYIYT